MMNQTIVVTVVLGVLSVACSGCGRAACKTFYEECDFAIVASEDDFVDDCVDEYYDEDDECREAFRDLASCVADQGCDDTDCADEAVDVVFECGATSFFALLK
jgi:hypothetical protein